MPDFSTEFSTEFDIQVTANNPFSTEFSTEFGSDGSVTNPSGGFTTEFTFEFPGGMSRLFTEEFTTEYA